MIQALKWVVLISTVAAGLYCPEAQARRRHKDSARFSFTYTPSFPISGKNLKLDRTYHNVGVEVAAGREVRYHLAILYGNLRGLSTFRVEPLAFGIPIELHDGRDVELDLEPVLSVLNAGFIVTGPNAQIVFSSGVRMQLNISVDRFYAAIVPIGFDLRYYGTRAGAGGAVDFRPQIFIGANFD